MPDPSRYETLARGALLEITPAATVGDFAGEIDEGEGAVSVLFESAQPGYPGWKWTVSIAQVDGEEPTVLEAELMPSDGALLSPDWVPWSDRLAEYKAAQEALGAGAAPGDSSDDGPDEFDDDADDELDDDDDPDEDDDTADDESDDEDDELDEDDILGNDVLHGGDLDGVDIDDPDLDDPDDLDSGDPYDDPDDEAEKTY